MFTPGFLKPDPGPGTAQYEGGETVFQASLSFQETIAIGLDTACARFHLSDDGVCLIADARKYLLCKSRQFSFFLPSTSSLTISSSAFSPFLNFLFLLPNRIFF